MLYGSCNVRFAKLAETWSFLFVVSSGEENERKTLEGFLYPYLSEPKR